MKISLMPSIMHLAHLSNDAVHMIGLHGIGKSKIVEQLAKMHDMHLEILMLSQNDVADLIGMPGDEDTEDGRVMYWSKPAWLDRMIEANKNGKHCVLFLDELARAPLEIRQAALTLVLDHRIHEHHLPELDGLQTLVVAADNPSDEYQTDELDPALLDRFMTYKVETDYTGWLKWARDNNLETVITDFVAEYPDKLHAQFPDAEYDKGSTPRGFAKLSDIIKNIDVIDEALHYEVFVSKLGDNIGSAFWHWYGSYSKIIKVEDITNKIAGMPIETEQEQKDAAKVLSELTLEIEQISANEIAQKIKKEIEDGKQSMHLMTVFLGSLNLEIAASTFKVWKEENDRDVGAFYYDWSETMPGRWLFMKIYEYIQ